MSRSNELCEALLFIGYKELSPLAVGTLTSRTQFHRVFQCKHVDMKLYVGPRGQFATGLCFHGSMPVSDASRQLILDKVAARKLLLKQ